MHSGIVTILRHAVLSFVLATPSLLAAEPIKVLIADGHQKYHNYKQTTPVLKQILEKSGRFKVL